VKFLRYIFGLTLVLTLGACRQQIPSQQSFRSTGAHPPLTANAPVAPASTDNSAATQTNAVNNGSATPGRIFIDADVDYGAELFLVDTQGRQVGYDPSVHHTVENLSGASYVDESITDAADSSDDPAVGESKRLHFAPARGSSYWLHVIPTNRTQYRLGLRCKGPNGSSRLQAAYLGISSGEEHVFSISPIGSCSDRVISGAFVNAAGQAHPLLTYAFPTSANVTMASSNPARIVVVYDKDILPSSFIATINGQAITQLFHPKAGTIESVTFPTTRGDNILQLSVTNAGDQANHSVDSFTIHVN
jgi:hypothetical protein